MDKEERNVDAAKPAATGRHKALNVLVKYGVPLVISVGLCYLLFRRTDFDQMMDIIRSNCDFRWILLALVVSVFSHILRAMRWGIQLRALGVKPPLFILILSIFGTYAVNLVLPRLGELWRSGYIAQRQRAPFTTVFGSMVADRLADTVTVLLLTAFAFVVASGKLLSYLEQNMESYDRMMALATSPWLWLSVAAVIAAVWWVFHRYPDNKVLEKIKGFGKGLWDGFAVIVKMKGKGRWLLYTCLMWGCYFFQLYVAFFSFPATADVVTRYGITAVLVCFVLSSISMGVPSNGGIGPWQWAIIFGLSMYSAGIPELTKEYATSFANLVMGSQTLLLIVLGLFTFVAVAIDKKRHQNNA